MKKNKFLAMLLAAMMTFGVAGCGGEGDTNDGDAENGAVQQEEQQAEQKEENSFVGEWDCVGYDVDGQSMTEDECGESELTLRDNYTCKAEIMDQNYEGEWDFTESGVVLYIEDGGYEEEIYCDMVDDVMYMDYMDMYTLFMKAD